MEFGCFFIVIVGVLMALTAKIRIWLEKRGVILSDLEMGCFITIFLFLSAVALFSWAISLDHH